MSALPSSRKTHSERHKQILKQLLKEPANKVCVDCKTASHPRWASWNLGCFICIRCSGIHRLMGTHISRVKSVDLDAWTDEQVELMVKWGNAKCNAYWEAKLPDQYVPDGLKIENFIRTKYDLKKWVASAHVPDPSSISAANGAVSAAAAPSTHAASAPVSASNTGASSGSSSHSAAIKKVSSHQSRSSAPAVSLLDDDFGTFTSSPLPTPAPAPAQAPAPAVPQYGGQSVQNAAPLTSDALSPPPRALNERKDLKKSILSLYSLPLSSQSSFQNGGSRVKANDVSSRTYGASQMGQTNSAPARSAGDLSSLSNSLSGLSFGAPSTPTTIKPQSPKQQPQVQSRDKPLPLWKNEWNESSSSVDNWGSSAGNSTSSINNMNGTTFNNWQTGNSSSNYTTSQPPAAARNMNLDDDLFKNVWS